MMIFAIIKEYLAYSDYVFDELLSPVGALIWLGSFCFAILLFYIVIDAVKKWNRKME